jgi:hypothetical protein
VGRCSPPQWYLAIPVVEITIAAFKDVWEPKPNATVSIDEENWKLKHGFLDVAANVDSAGWGPSHLGYNGALSYTRVDVQQ